MKIKYAIGSVVLLSSVLLCSAGADMASAESVISTESIMTQSTLSKISPIKTNNIIAIDNKKVLLYPTFQNPQSAIDGINKEAAELLNTLSQRFALGELTTATWLDYRSAADQYATENTSMSEQDTVQYNLLNRFFDIYENQDKNNAITELVAQNTFSKAALDNSELALLLPYTSDISSNFNTTLLRLTALLMQFLGLIAQTLRRKSLRREVLASLYLRMPPKAGGIKLL